MTEPEQRDPPARRADAAEHFRRMFEPGFGRISALADVAPSPDGSQIALTGSRLDRLEGVHSRRICLVPAAGGPIRQATAGPDDDRAPAWSPDGTRLAFLSDRGQPGSFRLHILEAGSLGEATPGPAIEGSAESVSWSPDGGSVLVTVAGKGAELAGVQGSGSAPGDGGEAPAWAPSVERSSDREGWRRAWVVAADGSAQARPASREGLNVWEAVWCGPERLAAIVSEDPSEDAWYTACLALIDVSTGSEQVIGRSEVQLGLPAATSDGRRLAAVEALCSDRMVVAGDVLMFENPAGAGEPVRLETAGVDVTHLAWRDTDHLVFAGVRDQRAVTGEVDVARGETREILSDPGHSAAFYPRAAPIGTDAVVAVTESWEHPQRLVVARPGEIREVASVAHPGHEYVRGIAGRVEEVAWTAPDGLEIHGLLACPTGGGPHPTIMLVHGGPISVTTQRFPYGSHLPLLVDRGFAVFMPNPRGSSGRGQKFAAMVYGDAGGGDAGDLLSGLDALVARGVSDPARLGVMGGSYGGFMTAWLVGHTDRFRAAVAISPVIDWYSQHHTSNIGAWDRAFLKDDPSAAGEYFARSPLSFAPRVRTPTLLTAGLRDHCTPPGQAIEFHRALVEGGAESELVLYPQEGHGVRHLPATIDFTARLLDWFDRNMGPEALG